MAQNENDEQKASKIDGKNAKYYIHATVQQATK